MHETLPLLMPGDFPVLQRGHLETVQVNLGYLCNQSCLHCHVNAGPRRKEVMTAATLDELIRYLEASAAQTLDLTGGAPELNPGFRRLVKAARTAGIKVIDRCNLTVLLEPGQAGTAEFLADNEVEIVASLPCYLEENVNKQRGDGCFAASIRVLRLLNELGYGRELPLNLMYNPQGPALPPPQAALERDYKRHLAENYAVQFNRLLTLTNMPIKRFGSMLVSQGRFDEYMDLLRAAHRDENLEGVMCRSLVSIDWKGYVYDCDFNQMLGLPTRVNGKRRLHVSDLIDTDLSGNPIVVANHCYGCTAGQGSGCGGALEA